MGLRIRYALSCRAMSRCRIGRLVQQLRQKALAMPFAAVGPLIDWPGRWPDAVSSACRLATLRLGGVLRAGLERSGDDQRRMEQLPLDAMEFVAFEARAGRGCRPTSFGLGRARSSTQRPDGSPFDVVDIAKQLLWPGSQRLKWNWRADCETQFASNPVYGGERNFVKCHLLVMGLLLYAGALGMEVTVHDDGGYWPDFRTEDLLDRLKVWNVTTAGIIGGLQEVLGCPIDSRIKAFPNYEHLEAQFRSRVTNASCAGRAGQDELGSSLP